TPPENEDAAKIKRIWEITMGDEKVVNRDISWHPTRANTREEIAEYHAGSSIHVKACATANSDAYGDIRPAAHRANDYLADWEAQRTRKLFGVPCAGAQDKAIAEGRGGVDCSLARLGPAGVGMSRVRARRGAGATPLCCQR